MSKLKILLVIASIIVGQLLAACAGQPAPTPTPTPTPTPKPTPTPAAIDAGKLYAANCVACHGDKRQGIANLGSALTPQSLAGKSDADIKNTVTNGKPNTVMLGWKDKLSPEEIEALVRLIKYTAP